MTGAATAAKRTSPYQGLRSYSEEDADFFFGRDRERDILVANLKASRLTVLYGPSGVGKTSLLRAGVESSLRKGAKASYQRLGTPEFVTVVLSAWQDDPSMGLSKEIAKQVERLTGEGMEPAGSLAETIVAAAARTDASLLLILDQFEDFSLYHSGQNGASTLAAEFPRLVNDRSLPVNVLVSIREDALAQLDRFKSTIPGLLDSRFRVDPLTGEDARKAATEPLATYNKLVTAADRVEIEDRLVSAVMSQVEVGKLRARHAGQGFVAGSAESGGEAPPPPGVDGPQPELGRGVEASYLQLVMIRLWEHEMGSSGTSSDHPHKLRLETLEALGGARQIVREHLGDALRTLSPDESDAAVDVFQYLVTPSGTKITQGLGTLAAWSRHPRGEVKSLLEKLEGDARIIRPVPPEPGTGEPRYEIFHDVLADPMLDWSAAESQKRRLADLARENERLEQEKREAEKRAAVERRRRLLAVALLLLALAGVAVAIASWRSAISERNTAQRERSRATYVGLASTAQALLPTRPDLSALLALQAFLHTPSSLSPATAQSAMISALEEIRGSGAIGILHGHTDAVTSVVFDPRGSTLASAGGDGTIRLWNPSTRQQVGRPLFGRGGAAFTVAFSPDGRVLASGHQTGTVEFWNMATRALSHESSGSDTAPAVSVAYSPNRSRVAAASADGKIRLWHAANDLPQGDPQVLTDPSVRSIAFSHDSRLLAAVGSDSTGGAGRIRLWNLAAPGSRFTEKSLGRPLYGVAFSPTADALVTGGLDGRVWLSDPAGAKPVLLGHAPQAVDSVSYSPDGQLVASGSADDKIELWNVATKAPAGPVRTGHSGMVTSVAFSHSGGLLASGSTDRTVRLWNYSPQRGFEQTIRIGPQIVPNKTKGSVTAVAFDPRNGTLAWAERDPGNKNTIRLWDVLQDRAVAAATVPGAVNTLSFSPNGGLLVSAGEHGTVQIWNVPSLSPYGGRIPVPHAAIEAAAFSPSGDLLAFAGAGTIDLRNIHTRRTTPIQTGKTVYAIAFNADGTELASGGEARTITVWNVATGRRLRRLNGHTDAVFTLAFGPRGQLLASGSADDTVRLWNVSSGHESGQPLTGHSGYVRSVAFSPNGRILISGSADHTVRLWDVASGTQLGQQLNADAFVNSVAVSPDGSTLAAGSRDGALRLWSPIGLPPTSTALRREVCGLVGAGLSSSERSRYAPGYPYNSPCG